MKNDSNILWQVSLMVFMIGIIIFIVILILRNMGNQIDNYYQETCNEMNGSLVVYSGCNCDGYFVECGCEYEGGVYCELNNGTKVDITIRNAES